MHRIYINGFWHLIGLDGVMQREGSGIYKLFNRNKGLVAKRIGHLKHGLAFLKGEL